MFYVNDRDIQSLLDIFVDFRWNWTLTHIDEMDEMDQHHQKCVETVKLQFKQGTRNAYRRSKTKEWRIKPHTFLPPPLLLRIYYLCCTVHCEVYFGTETQLRRSPLTRPPATQHHTDQSECHRTATLSFCRSSSHNHFIEPSWDRLRLCSRVLTATLDSDFGAQTAWGTKTRGHTAVQAHNTQKEQVQGTCCLHSSVSALSETLPRKNTFNMVLVLCTHVCICYGCLSMRKYTQCVSVCIMYTYPVAGEASAVWQGQIGGCHVTNVQHSSNSWQDSGPRVTLTQIHKNKCKNTQRDVHTQTGSPDGELRRPAVTTVASG